MAYNYEYPYTDPYRYNADWMARIVKECQDNIKGMDEKLDRLFDAIEDDVKEYLDERCLYLLGYIAPAFHLVCHVHVVLKYLRCGT